MNASANRRRRFSRGLPITLPALELHPRTRNWIVGVVLLAIAALIALGLFSAAGPLGDILARILNYGFGWGAWFIPIILAGIAILAFQTERRLAGAGFVGGALLIGSLLALLTVVFGEESSRGGIAGRFIASPFLTAVGPSAAFLVFMALGVIGAFILLNFPAERERGIAIFSFLRERLRRKSLSSLHAGGTIEKESRVPFGDTPIRPPSFRIRPLTRDEQPESGEMRETPSPQQNARSGADFLPKGETLAASAAYTPPPLNLLDGEKGSPKAGDVRANMQIIKRTFGNFGIPVEMGEVTIGPTVTQYTLKPAEGVKLSQISSLGNDLALALAAHPIRIEAPIPGRSLVGIEVPNQQAALVRLRHLLAPEEFRVSPYRLTFALGRDVAGSPFYAALERMPHLLIAGATGTGKTIALNALITALLYRNPPQMLRLLLIDPKRVEFPVFNDVPHLLTPVVVDIEKTIHALRWAVSEMERRFDVLSTSRTRDIASFNQARRREEEPMPYLVIVIDELADIMAARGREAEAAIVRLAQMARAVGIHLVVATQRPSVEVITGLIKANITSRMAFQVASQVDSRTILDGAGAEKLLGNGDMLFVSAETSKPRRIQGTFVSEKEVRRVADFLKHSSAPQYAEGVTDPREGEEGEWLGSGNGLDEDPLYEEAKRLVIQVRKASASYLQRRLRVGYARAARLVDLLEERGVVGPGEGAKPREVLFGLQREERAAEQDEGGEKGDWT